MSEPASPPPDSTTPPTSRLGLWILLGAAGFCFLPWVGILVWMAITTQMGSQTPTYKGEKVPQHFRDTMRSVGALEDGETILYFYSDALTDIRNGFYFVSDRKVAIYVPKANGSPLTAVPFDQIEYAKLERDRRITVDSRITLNLKDGRRLTFPVNDEDNRDQKFFDEIQRRIAKPR